MPAAGADAQQVASAVLRGAVFPVVADAEARGVAAQRDGRQSAVGQPSPFHGDPRQTNKHPRRSRVSWLRESHALGPHPPESLSDRLLRESAADSVRYRKDASAEAPESIVEKSYEQPNVGGLRIADVEKSYERSK